MVNACADPDFFVREEREGWGGVRAQRRENSLDFFYVCFGVFWSKIFGGGPTIYEGGGGGPNANFYRI